MFLARSGSAESFLLDLMFFWTTVAEFTLPTQAFLSHAGKTGRRRKHLTRRMVTSVLKQMAVHFGFDDAFFSTHSLRIGGMSCGTKADMNNSTLCRIGGWSSVSEARYWANVPDSGILSVLMPIKWILQFPSSRLQMCVECFLHPYSYVFSCPLLARFGGGVAHSVQRATPIERSIMLVLSLIVSRFAYLGASAYDLSSHVS